MCLLAKLSAHDARACYMTWSRVLLDLQSSALIGVRCWCRSARPRSDAKLCACRNPAGWQRGGEEAERTPGYSIRPGLSFSVPQALMAAAALYLVPAAKQTSWTVRSNVSLLSMNTANCDIGWNQQVLSLCDQCTCSAIQSVTYSSRIWSELNWIELKRIELEDCPVGELNWRNGLSWVELDWVELNWVELNWRTELNWIGLNWIESDLNSHCHRTEQGESTATAWC